MGITETVTKKLLKNLRSDKIKKLAGKLSEKAKCIKGYYIERFIGKIKKHKKMVVCIIISFFSLAAIIYLGMSVYFMNHFYFKSEINGINVSGKSVDNVNKLMTAKLENYTLSLKERDGITEEIKGPDIGLSYISGGQFKALKDKQNPFKWISAVFNSEGYKMTEGIKYDERPLIERLYKLSCFDEDNIIEPKNAGFKYENGKYVIVAEVAGNKIDKDVLYKHVVEAVVKEETEVDLEAINCYIKPEYTRESQKVIETRDILNKYVSSKITYDFGDTNEILDGSTINKWLTVDDNYKVALNEEEVKNYVETLSNKYNTVGKKRNFVTSTGKTIKIGGGDYGRKINKSKEIEALTEAIKQGQTITKKPAYSQTALSYGSNDIGNTYVEIDLTKQHMWFYKNGILIAQGDVVTGNVSKGHTTPPGIYRLKYKQRNAILRGPDYASPVTFWMPFNGGIGIHDASWRSKFGGNIYKTNGSHGCINSPYNLAKSIFENIQPGTPVICYN